MDSSTDRHRGGRRKRVTSLKDAPACVGWYIVRVVSHSTLPNRPFEAAREGNLKGQLQLVYPYEIGPSPTGLAVDDTAGALYVANVDQSSISVIDTGTHRIVGTVPVPSGSRPQDLAVDPATGEVYVTTDNAAVVVLGAG